MDSVNIYDVGREPETVTRDPEQVKLMGALTEPRKSEIWNVRVKCSH